MSGTDLNETNINNFFGDMDLFLMDQILKGTIVDRGRVFDAGCGSGRHLVYFLQKSWEVWGNDPDKSQLELLRYLFEAYPNQDPNRLLALPVQDLDLRPDYFDLIICSRVLHFLPSVQILEKTWSTLQGLLKPDGILYFSMNSIINFDAHVLREKEGIAFADGTRGLFLSPPMIPFLESGYEKVMPHRTVHFEEQHAETTMILRKI